ncbi:MFS transporter [Actinokineospora cianjurensis]|uniref:Putative MFS family arabinose efflux permease n=1 Tax=Actinokineospora cianjurensis TaxID=585224 RepID=A0A421BC01_9PSEU|nr:MFS transporter [Actinokineospora cianjurensis]RLK61873.1 putative MFS family arabinose efflux permease [Actinokineospora cianjurensis]
MSGLRAHPRFLRVWLGQACGAVGDQLLPVAVSLYVISRGGGVAEVSLVLGARAVALVLCLLVGGVLADRVRRSRVLLGADWFRGALLLATAVALPSLPLLVMPVVVALVAAGEALSRPAFRSMVPTLLPGDMLERGNALVSAAQRSAAVLGALAGAAVVSFVGPRAALFAAGAVFAISGLTVLRLDDTAPAALGRSVLADAAAGVRAMRERPWVLAVMSTASVHLMTGTAAALTLLPLIAHDRLGGDLAYGAVLAAMAIGALPGLALAGRWRPRAKGVASMCVLSGYALVPLSLAVPLPLPVVMACFAIGGFAVEFFFVYWLSALQRGIPGEVLGKVLALDQLGAFALLPVGYLLVGPVVGAVGTGPTLVGAAVVVAATSALCLVVPGVARFADPDTGVDEVAAAGSRG